nr:DUF3299 domain-containing protein [uncultured Roseateles sp.]
MNRKLVRLLSLAALGAGLLGGQAQAQAPIGQGPGYHDPRSPFKPLQEREGIISWQLLSSVTTRAEKNKLIPEFPKPLQALNNQTVKIQGFMLPLEPGDKQRHFLLSSVPTSCSFCVPAGPEGLVEVKTKNAVKYTLEPVVVEGRMAVLNADPYGMFYRVTEAQATQ